MTQSAQSTKSNTPANRPESEAAKASRNAPFDFSALTIQDEEARPTRKNTKAADPEQMKRLVDALRNSWEKRDEDGFGSGKSLTVPTELVNRVSTMIRKAADRLNEDELSKTPIGTNISHAKNSDGKTSKVTFAAKRRKFYAQS